MLEQENSILPIITNRKSLNHIVHSIKTLTGQRLKLELWAMFESLKKKKEIHSVRWVNSKNEVGRLSYHRRHFVKSYATFWVEIVIINSTKKRERRLKWSILKMMLLTFACKAQRFRIAILSFLYQTFSEYQGIWISCNEVN